MGRKKTNVMIIGDGKGKTVITGGKNFKQELTTFHTASFGKFPFILLIMALLSNYYYFITTILAFFFLFGKKK